MITGTCHFVGWNAAMGYYRQQGNMHLKPPDLARLVDGKLSSGEIYLGPPTLKPGQILRRIDDGQRYAIEERTP